MIRQRTIHQEAELIIMKYLNQRRDYSTHYFNCGELGYLRIYWISSRWEKEWFDLESMPELIVKERNV